MMQELRKDTAFLGQQRIGACTAFVFLFSPFRFVVPRAHPNVQAA